MKQRTNGLAMPQRLLVISDQSGFSRDLVARWQMQPHLPEFTALSSELWHGSASSPFDLVVAGDIKAEITANVLKQLNRGVAPSIYVAALGEQIHVLRREYSRVTIIPHHDAWLDTLVLVAEETLKRSEICAHIERMEADSRAKQAQATLGKYMVEMRHSFNNALTSVLGNAELLLLESAILNPNMREQLETLHSMTLRLHEMMQRFTSLELEMQCAERSLRSADAPAESSAYAVRA
jgi:signal transduction histidine kinase